MTFTTRAQTSLPADLSFLPAEALDEIARVFQFGAGKHGRDNWRTPEPNGGNPLRAAERHIAAHERHVFFDHETGFYHLAHAAARLIMALGRAQQTPKCAWCAIQLPRLRRSPMLETAGFSCPQCGRHYPAFRVVNEGEIQRPASKPRVPARQTRIMADIISERKRQDHKFGPARKLGNLKRNAILGEEVGEVARAILERDPENLREELVQVAACCVDWLEEIDRAELEKAAKASK